MSLFKLKTLWSTCFPNEQFDDRHVALGKIFDKACIIVGGFKGILRVYIAFEQNKTINVNLIYEADFEQPIIDVKFITHPDEAIKYAAGILFFRKLGCMSLEKQQDRYVIKVRFIEVDPGFAISTNPLSIITLNSKIQYINPLSTQNIKVSEPIFPFTKSIEDIYYMDGEELVMFRGSSQQWRVLIGSVKYLYVVGGSIVAIGDKAVWEVSNANINKTKVFEDDISYGTVIVKHSSDYNILVANYNLQMLFYSSKYELLWAIKLDEVVLKVIVCHHTFIKGALLILLESGTVQISYSGTQPPSSTLTPIPQQLSMESIQHQTKILRKQLDNKKQDKTANKVYEGASNDGIIVKVACIVDHTQQHIENKQKLLQRNQSVIRTTLNIQLKPTRQPLVNIKAIIRYPSNMLCPNYQQLFTSIKNKQQLAFVLYTNNQKFPFEQLIELIIKYEESQKKQPQIYRHKISIPMQSQCHIIGWESPNKLPHKIVIESNSQLPSFNELFPQLIKPTAAQQRKSVTFQLANSIQCSITYNKSFNKAKFESEYYGSLCYIFVEYVRHLELLRKNNNKIMLEIPLQQFFGVMKEHYDHRIILKDSFKQLEKRSQQFRNTQKKLLLKMKQKMSSINHVDKLLQYTYKALLDAANSYQSVRDQMEVVNHNLQVAIKFVTQMVFLRSAATQKVKKSVLAILGYQKQSLQRGWQESVIANSTYFLNKKYNKDEDINFQKLQKIPLWIIAKVNNGEWSYQ